MARGTSSSSSSSSEEDDAESSTSEMLSESEPLEEDDDESGSEEDENLGRLNLGPRRVVVNRVAKLKDHWKQTLSAVDSVKEKIPSWTYVKLVDFIKDEWSNCR